MTALAVNGIEGLESSDLELASPGTSYTASTLERFHEQGARPSQIFFILGADAFAEIETWNRYPDVLDMSNFVVVSRPGYDIRRIAESLPALSKRFGHLAPAQARVASDTHIFILPAATPDVSSTEIRRRLRASEPVTGLVSEPVERHIKQHRLYVDEEPSSPLIHSTADHLHGEN
jgi:nicotinate-nucleotide adenylyltransferase